MVIGFAGSPVAAKGPTPSASVSTYPVPRTATANISLSRPNSLGPFAATGEPANPITILHRHSSLWENETELCVAVLHEAVHWLDARAGHSGGKKDQRAGSRAEAIHDLNCYAALDYDVPSGHPGFGLLPAGESASAAPERTDPCPCGSGKKYKRCCG